MKKSNYDYQLTDRQLEIVTGSMLGDGFLRAVGKHNVKNSYYVEGHSIKQYEWLKWKFNELKPLTTNIVLKKVPARKNQNGRVVRDTNNYLEECRFQTLSHPTLTEFEKMWYLRDDQGDYVLHNKKRIKTVPLSISLTPLIIAVWFFDDGSTDPARRVAQFNTQSFTKCESELLAEQLRDFNIQCGVSKSREQFIISVRASSYLNLIKLVSEHIRCEAMNYKVDLQNYREPDLSSRFQQTITEVTARKIIKLCNRGFGSTKIAKQLGVGRGLVDGIRHGVTWKALSHLITHHSKAV